MIAFLVYLVVMLVILGLVYFAVTLLPLPQPFKTAIVIIIILIFVLLLLGALTGAVPMPNWQF